MPQHRHPLAAKSLVSSDHKQGTSSHENTASKSKSKRSGLGGNGAGNTQGVYSMANIETRVDAQVLSSSQERIVEREGEEFYPERKGINKTVEFVFHESESPV